MYLYHKDATTIKEAMENIERACALGGVSVVAPVETRTTQSAPFTQMTDSPDARNEPRKGDDVKFAGLKYQGKVEYICHAWQRRPPFPVNLRGLASLRLEGMQAKYSSRCTPLEYSLLDWYRPFGSLLPSRW